MIIAGKRFQAEKTASIFDIGIGVGKMLQTAIQFKIKWTCDIGNATGLGEVTWEEYVGRTEMGAWDQAFWHVDILD